MKIPKVVLCALGALAPGLLDAQPALPDLVQTEAVSGKVLEALQPSETAIHQDRAAASTRFRFVYLDAQVLDNSGGWPRTFVISMFKDTVLTATVTPHSPSFSLDSGLFVGEIDGVPGSRISVVRKPGDVFYVRVRLPGQDGYLVRPAKRAVAGQPVHAVYNLARVGFGNDVIVGEQGPPPSGSQNGGSPFPTRILVVPTVDVQLAWGGGDSFEFEGLEIVDDINQTLEHSGLLDVGVVELAGAPALPIEPLATTCTGVFQELLSDPAWSDYWIAARDGTAADLIFVVANFDGALGCAPSFTDIGNFLAVLHPAAITVEPAAAHEFGHMAGAGHEDGYQGLYFDSRAYIDSSFNGTAMGSSSIQYQLYPIYSSPDISYGPLDPAGNQDTRNVYTLIDTLFILEGYFFGDPVEQTVIADPTGSGSVFSPGGEIDCPGQCSDFFPLGEHIRFTAEPDPGWAVGDWSGGCTVDPFNSHEADFYNLYFIDPCQVEFVEDGSGSDPRLTITKSGTGNGAVVSSPAGINCDENCSSDDGFFAESTPITLTATAGFGFSFVHWGGDCSDDPDNPLMFNMSSGDLFCTAEFATEGTGNPVVLTLAKAGDGFGGVATQDGRIVCASNCPGPASATYESGDQVTLQAEAQILSDFFGWTDDCSGGPDDDEIDVIVWTDTDCTAVFVPEIVETEYFLTLEVHSQVPTEVTSVSVTPGSHVCTSDDGPSDCEFGFPNNLEVTMRAFGSGDVDFTTYLCDTDGDGQHDVTSTNPVTDIVMTSDISCLATFLCSPPWSCP